MVICVLLNQTSPRSTENVKKFHRFEVVEISVGIELCHIRVPSSGTLQMPQIKNCSMRKPPRDIYVQLNANNATEEKGSVRRLCFT